MDPLHVVMGNFFVAPGMRAKVCLNDVPLFPAPITGHWAKQMPVNHRLIAGDNVVSVALEAFGPSAVHASLDERAVERFVGKFFKQASSAQGDFEVLADITVDAAWEGVDEERQRYPFYAVATFTPNVPIGPPRWVGAEVSELPCEGDDAVADAVRNYYEAIVAGDRRSMIDLSEPFFADRENAYPDEGYFSRGTLIREMDEMLARNPVFEPLEPSVLHYEPCAGGRVVHVSRLDGRATLQASAGANRSFKTDLLLTKTDAGWRVM